MNDSLAALAALKVLGRAKSRPASSDVFTQHIGDQLRQFVDLVALVN